MSVEDDLRARIAVLEAAAAARPIADPEFAALDARFERWRTESFRQVMSGQRPEPLEFVEPAPLGYCDSGMSK